MKDFLRLKMINMETCALEIKSLVFENKIKRERTGFQLLLIKTQLRSDGKTQAGKILLKT